MHSGFQSRIKSTHFDSWYHLWYFYSPAMKKCRKPLQALQIIPKTSSRNPLKVVFKPFTNSQMRVYSAEIRFCHFFGP